MEAVELVVFLVFALFAAAIIIGFIFEFDFENFQKALTAILLKEQPTTGVQKVNFNTFLTKIYDCHVECLMGNIGDGVDCGSFHLQTIDRASNELDTIFIQTKIVSVNYCEDCNVVVVPSPPDTGIALPSVLNMSCQKTDAGKGYISIR